MQALLLIAVTVVSAPPEPEDATVLEVEALVDEALDRHPALSRARRSAAAASHIPERVGSLPDPAFMFAAQNIRTDEPALDKSPMTGLVFGLRQSVPFPGKLGHREGVATGLHQVAREDVALLEARIAEDVRRAYWRLYFAERAVTITDESVRVLDTLTDVVHARYGVGQGAQQDALQAQVAHSRLRSALERRRQGMDSARRTLSAAVGRPPGATLPPTRAPDEEPARLQRSVLLAQARDHGPRNLAARARVEASHLALAEAEYDRWPDFAVGAGYRLRKATMGDPTEGADMFTVDLAVTLPVFMAWKQNARVRENTERVGAATAAAQDVALAVDTAVQRTIDAIERLDRELALYRKELLPQADDALNASIADYQVARVGFVSVLQNWRAQLEVRLAYEKLRAERAEGLAELRALVGEPERGKP